MRRLYVFKGNYIAIKLYKKIGFKEVGVLKNEIKRGEKYFDVIVMEYYL
ncbi:GNAT family N-acetyltransferase [Acidianus brierleyi]|nr:GNAT family protein [Acidianus brierleyi]